MSRRQVQLRSEVRVALDAVRVIAAFYVVAHHLAIRADLGIFALPLRFGQEAVMAFFLLSGFVIHSNERERAADWKGYGLRRFFRIYPTLCIAMFLSAAVAMFDGVFFKRFDWHEALCTLTALQDSANLKPGTICAPFMGNSPLWSLSYEVVFYSIYPFVLRSFHRAPLYTNHVIGVLTLVLILSYSSQPSHFLLLPAYFIIWWVGAMMAEVYLSSGRDLRAMKVPLGYLTGAVGLWTAVVFADGGVRSLGTYPFLMVRHFLLSLIFAAAAFSPLGHLFLRVVARGSRVAWGWLSSISYGVYVFHLPLLIQWSVSDTWVGFLAAFLLLLIFSELADNRLNSLLRRLMRR